MGKLASNPGMFWILCASHKQFNLLASIVKKRMRKPWIVSRMQRIDDSVTVLTETLPVLSSVLILWFTMMLLQEAQQKGEDTRLYRICYADVAVYTST